VTATRSRFALPLLAGLAAACATFRPSGPATPVALEIIDEVRVDLDAPAIVERAVRQRLMARPELELVADPAAPQLRVHLHDVRNAQLPGSDPRLRAPRYRVAVELWAEVQPVASPEGVEPEVLTARAVGEAVYVARAGEIGRLDGAYRTFLSRAAEEAADRVVDILAARLARFTSGER
jgi:hypothetical protein